MAHIDSSQNRLNLSVEQTPSKIEKRKVSESVVNTVDYITIPHLSDNSLKVTYKSIVTLSDTYGVDPSRVIPHIAARSIKSKSELSRQLKNFGDIGVRDVLVVGGNPSQPRGPYSRDEEVRERAREFGKFRIYCGVYPDSDSVIDTLMNKYSRFNGGITQLCLSPNKLEGFRPSTRFGIPSKANWDGLYRYMKICGVAPSIRYPVRNIFGVIRFMTLDGFDTSRLVEKLRPHSSFHVYDFGRIEETIEELNLLYS